MNAWPFSLPGVQPLPIVKFVVRPQWWSPMLPSFESFLSHHKAVRSALKMCMRIVSVCLPPPPKPLQLNMPAGGNQSVCLLQERERKASGNASFTTPIARAIYCFCPWLILFVNKVQSWALRAPTKKRMPCSTFPYLLLLVTWKMKSR